MRQLLTFGGLGSSAEAASYSNRTFFAEDRAGLGSVMAWFALGACRVSLQEAFILLPSSG